MKNRPSDYTYMFWNHGWRGKSPDGRRVMSIQAGKYGCAFDTRIASIINFGAVEDPLTAGEALVSGNDALYDLPSMALQWHLTAGESTYRLSSSFEKGNDKKDLEDLKLPLTLLEDEIPGEQTRIIVSGRFVQRFDMENLCFENEEGERLGVSGRAEVTALPEGLSVMMEIEAGEEIELTALSACLQVGSAWRRDAEGADSAEKVTLIREDAPGFTFSSAHGAESDVRWDQDSSAIHIRTSVEGLGKDQPARLTFFLRPSTAGANILRPVEPADITARGISPYTAAIIPEYDEDRGLYWLSLPDISESWDLEHNRDLLERVKLSITNPTATPVRVPLVFSKEKSVPGITGLTPMLRSTDGIPLGIPVQISKNWHAKEGQTILYEGPWFQGYTLVDVEPNATFEGELTIAYAQWGGLPAASHAQLCLIGYGGNQLWDEAAIGSFGESITYDPDVNLGRSIIDDVRPLMVRSMHGGKWSWTNNVGGGDFLVYFNAEGEKQFLTRMKTYYEHYGPNLTKVHYAGVSADGKIDAHLVVSTPRCDDLNRAYHSFRYDIRETVDFSRLAFYQLGSDGYNNHQFNRMAWGNGGGLREEWQPGKGGLRYERTGFPCEGEQVWFSLHDAVPGLYHGEKFLEPQGPWANRGMVIRSWSARLGGKELSHPYASVFLTEDNVGSANVELSAPPGITRLLPGDFVEAEIEYLVLPMNASDYYGPNEALRKSLEASANTWKPVHRQAAGNHLAVTASVGTVLKPYPVVIRVDASGHAEFTVEGGISFVPLVFTGLPSRGKVLLQERTGDSWREVDQAVHGNDFWQTGYEAADNTWTQIFNVELDGYEGTSKKGQSRHMCIFIFT